MRKKIIRFIAILTLYASVTQSQERRLPNNFMNDQRSEQLLTQTNALSDEKLVKAQAKLLRKHYEALIETGFSKAEALQIIVAMASRDK